MPDRFSDPDPTDLDLPDREWAAHHRAMAIVECPLCDQDGYRGGYVCNHVDYAEIAARGMEAVRKALTRENT